MTTTSETTTRNDARSSPGTVLVTGGTGTTGRRVADRLRAGAHPARIASRAGAPRFDWHDRDTWAGTVDGIAAAYLAYSPDLAFPGAAETIGAFARFAVERGVTRLVLLSGRGEPRAQHAEELVQEAGAEWTIVRCAMFAQNFSEGVFAGQVMEGVVAMHVDDVLEPFVDVEDVADVAVAALTDPRHGGEVYELTGPRLLTFTEALTMIADVIGQPVAYVKVDVDDLVARLTRSGLPASEASLLVTLLDDVLDGHNSHLCDGVERALGRPAHDFADFVATAAAAGAWAAMEPA